MVGISRDELVEPRIDRVLTQYRESPRLLHLIRSYLRQAEDVAAAVHNLPDYFDVRDAVGDQLTLIGKRLGWPRTHCVSELQAVFGFDTDEYVEPRPIAEFNESGSTWLRYASDGAGRITLADDDLYRRFLLVRRRQALALFDLASLTACAKTLWGDQAVVVSTGRGRVVFAPGRPLTAAETAAMPLYPRVMPLAPGIVARFHLGSVPVFGFGEGWLGFGVQLAASNITDAFGLELTDENGIPITTGPLTSGGPWTEERDAFPYTRPAI